MGFYEAELTQIVDLLSQAEDYANTSQTLIFDEIRRILFRIVSPKEMAAAHNEEYEVSGLRKRADSQRREIERLERATSALERESRNAVREAVEANARYKEAVGGPLVQAARWMELRWSPIHKWITK